MSDPEILRLLERYSFLILPVLVIAEQVGVPLPAVPALLAVGAMAASGRGSIPLVLAAIVLVALAVDLGWYEVGRRRGARVLTRLCRLALEPDFCVRRAETIFTRYGVRAMLVAKFIPGVTTVTPPLAGIFQVGRLRFAIYEVVGVVLWAGVWLGLGYAFSDAIEALTLRVARLGRLLGLAVAVALVGYLAVKYARRRLFMRRLRIARITPTALHQRLAAGEDVTIIDLRSRLDVAATPYAIPGSHWVDVDRFDTDQWQALRGRELVLYCSCPGEATSARVALRLRRRGITRVHPLEGGLARWMEEGFPVEALRLPDAA
jgi:membrane protein DedA with SNARE-associated domain/rhodanese-related sulfurtransferase